MSDIFSRMFGGGGGRVPAGAPPTNVAHALTLYQYAACPYCQRVLRALPRLGVDVELKDTRNEPSARRELLDLTGRTQVPCLVIDGKPMFESADILAWLEAYAAHHAA